ncbi:UNKNOWN [Stylonychia lemnae]|uniref:Uncharacterized protein n=1 Tax=Stylonychia lemnae TaxID=5949 RepID=A0A078B7H5_STYLE|nr:UNKNOWN [Stylonychia lemnae]|eukprot:CDW90171.1 UNKNOWN [Stylonychia lemnae]
MDRKKSALNNDLVNRPKLNSVTISFSRHMHQFPIYSKEITLDGDKKMSFSREKMRRQSNTNHRLKKQPRQTKREKKVVLNGDVVESSCQYQNIQKDFLIEEVGIKQNASQENIHDNDLNMIQYLKVEDDGNFTNPQNDFDEDREEEVDSQNPQIEQAIKYCDQKIHYSASLENILASQTTKISYDLSAITKIEEGSKISLEQ